MKLEDLDKYEIPKIKLTQSVNYQTGTATFIFSEKIIFQLVKLNPHPIEQLQIVINNHWIISNKAQITFKKGKPEKIFFTFLLKNPKTWEQMTTFLKTYAQNNKLTQS